MKGGQLHVWLHPCLMSWLGGQLNIQIHLWLHLHPTWANCLVGVKSISGSLSDSTSVQPELIVWGINSISRYISRFIFMFYLWGSTPFPVPYMSHLRWRGATPCLALPLSNLHWLGGQLHLQLHLHPTWANCLGGSTPSPPPPPSNLS